MQVVRLYRPDSEAQVKALRLLLGDPSSSRKQPRAMDVGHDDASESQTLVEVGQVLQTAGQETSPSLTPVGMEANRCFEV
jgi:hypothetical protein